MPLDARSGEALMKIPVRVEGHPSHNAGLLPRQPAAEPKFRCLYRRSAKHSRYTLRERGFPKRKRCRLTLSRTGRIEEISASQFANWPQFLF